MWLLARAAYHRSRSGLTVLFFAATNIELGLLLHAGMVSTALKLASAFSAVNLGGLVETMNNTPWQRACREMGSPDLRIHDLRHTVGMRLREAEVREETIADILWHVRPGMTAHYSVAQVAELVDALNRITDERSRTNRNLAMIAREARGETGPHKVPMQMKNG
jgi:hypothetical protein